ncbi:ankyrin repeat-containing domain protein [Cladorrhinum sp. PSN332]|nr:ankyrin repeat-containing domain protein [Cladorrhinum sp. PSN332]
MTTRAEVQNAPLNWDKYENEILDLFISQNKPLHDVAKYMCDKHGFNASERQYKHRYKGLKNVKSEEWRYIADELGRRSALGEQCSVYLHGRKLPSSRVTQATSRVRGTGHRVTKPGTTDSERCNSYAGRIFVGASPPISQDGGQRQGIPSFLGLQVQHDAEASAFPENVQPQRSIRDDSHINLEMRDTSYNGFAHEDQAPLPYPPQQVVNTETIISTNHPEPGISGLNEIPECGVIFGRDLESAMEAGGFSPALWQSLDLEGMFQSPGQDSFVLQDFADLQFDFQTAISQTPRALSPAMNIYCTPGAGQGLLLNIPWFQVLSLIDGQNFRLTTRQNSSASGSRCSPASRAISNEKAQSGLMIIGQFLGLGDVANYASDDDLAKMASRFQDFIPEREAGEIPNALSRILNPSSPLPTTLLWLFAVTAFFASNNRLQENQMDSFLRWITDHKHTKSLAQFIQKIQTPTMHAFAMALVQSSIRIKSIDVINELLIFGVKLDSLMGEIALLGDIRLTKRLLDAADPSYFTKKVGTHLFHHLVTERHFKEAEFLLHKGVWVDAELLGQTALIKAVQRDDIDTVSFLLQHQANVNWSAAKEPRGYQQRTAPLQIAITQKLVEMSQVLVDNAASIDKVVIDGKSAMQWTSLHCREIYELLKKKMVTREGSTLPGDLVEVACGGQLAFRNFIAMLPNKVSAHELEQALEGSIQTGQIEATITLLGYGVDPNAPTLSIPPLKTALGCKKDKMKIVELLLHYNASASYPRILADLVSCFNRQDFLKRVLSLGVHVKEREEALRQAALVNDIVSAELLIEAGLDIDAPGTSLSPIQCAAFQGHDDMVLFLIDRKANMNAPAYDNGGLTALQAALTSETPMEMGRLLLRHGADASAPPALVGGKTPLEAYCEDPLRYGDTEPGFCFELLRAGATVNRPEGRPSSAIHGVIDRGWTDVLAHFLRPEHNAVVDQAWSDPLVVDMGVRGESLTPTQRAAHRGKLEALDMLLKHGTNVNEPPAHKLGRTALQAAAALEPGPKKMELVLFLLEHGADIHAKPALTSGFTALQGAAIVGDLKLAQLFLSRGANVNESPSFKDGRYAIEGAAEHGRLDMVQLLLNAGAKGNVARGTGLTEAIRLAEKKGHFAIVNMLKAEEKRWKEESAKVSGGSNFNSEDQEA